MNKKSDKGFILNGNNFEYVTGKQKFSQWWYGFTEPYMVKFADYMLKDDRRKEKFVHMSKPDFLPTGVIISTQAACRFIDFIYGQNTENKSARIAVTKCVCQTALNKFKEPIKKDMALLYTADMYTTLKHTGIKEKFDLVETAQEAKDMVRYFDKCGLMHNVIYCHSSGKWTFVLCNCDDEICIPVRSYLAGRRGEIGAGPEIVSYNENKCKGIKECGKCIERCKLKACFEGQNGKSAVILNECLGCGLCVTTCPEHARELEPRQDYKHEDVLTTKILLGEEARV